MLAFYYSMFLLLSQVSFHLSLLASHAYRKKVLYGQMRENVREIIQELCKYKGVEIISGAVCVDHVHLSDSMPPKLSPSNFMGYLKGKRPLIMSQNLR